MHCKEGSGLPIFRPASANHNITINRLFTLIVWLFPGIRGSLRGRFYTLQPTLFLLPPSLSLSQSSEIKTTWLCHNGVSDIADYVIEEMSVCNSAGYVSVRGRAVYFMTRFKIHDNVFCSVFVSLWSFYSANMHPSIITVHTLTHSLTHTTFFMSLITILFL